MVFPSSSELICSHQPIVALAGDDVILPCQLQPAVSVSSETTLWIRPGLDPKYIHVHEAGRQMTINQNPDFRQRTALFVDQLMNGNVSLKLFRVKPSDAGRYTCIRESKKMEASVQLIVGKSCFFFSLQFLMFLPVGLHFFFFFFFRGTKKTHISLLPPLLFAFLCLRGLTRECPYAGKSDFSRA
uniref:Ig-like domain-containing protein n=1 Tax=Sparus aurata TaxID=8175 RepID=A0A671TR22_SPAAU